MSYAGKRVFVTGDRGFVGRHLVHALRERGADVTGYDIVDGYDVLDQSGLVRRLLRAAPDVVFHLAAQAFVPVGYEAPKDTFAVNAQGTVNLLEALRDLVRPCAVVVVTSDKVYEPSRRVHDEESALGGHCPYSASKAAAEMVVTAYREGFFAPGHEIAVATARAGNIIGGGDAGRGRLVPNAIRALKAGQPIPVFNPRATRPWQYVEDVVQGYLRLGEALMGDGRADYAVAWNFGPDEERSVVEVVEALIAEWGYGSWEVKPTTLREVEALHISSARARALLGWHPCWSFEAAIRETAAWYRKN